jgi:hypothetical protein
MATRGGTIVAIQLVCTPKALPRNLWISAAAKAVAINPVNHPPIENLMRVMPSFVPQPEHIAVLTTKYWHSHGVKLTVGFMEAADPDLRARIISHMNAWGQRCNVTFTESVAEPQVRISREPGGYWSYLGTDILSIPADQQTMNLEAFTMQTEESEYHRVVRHETGHTLGCPHEHMRRELVDLIDRTKAISFFEQTQGWSEQEVVAQVLTPLEDNSLLGTPNADPNSIMCYQIPGTVTKSGQPIPGGTDITDQDFSFMSGIYPK